MHYDRTHLHNMHLLGQILCVFFSAIVSVNERTSQKIGGGGRASASHGLQRQRGIAAKPSFARVVEPIMR
jgi:hypothetical protein